MSHPFGDLVWQHIIRKRGLSQNKLAMGINQDPAVIARMCNGKALTGPLSRERVVQIIEWFNEQDVLEYVEEANALLAAADKPGLSISQPREAELLHTLKAQALVAPGTVATVTEVELAAGMTDEQQAVQQAQSVLINPYRGLFAFREEDAAYFCGRDTFTDTLVSAVHTQRKPMVAIIGPSGSGKSSVVFAGLIPRLRGMGEWAVAWFRPGERPFQSLAAALVPLLEPGMTETDRLVEVNKQAEAFRLGEIKLNDVAGRILEKNALAQRLLMVVDQFEELYTLCRDAVERQAFLDLLLHTVPASRASTEGAANANGSRNGHGSGNGLHGPHGAANIALVVTMRADFLGPALAYRPLVDALQGADLKLGSMTRRELQAAIEEPARQLGVHIEYGLTERILEVVSDEPGDLPLLEFALTLLWARQRNGMLTHAAYDEIGGVESALAGYAEEVFEELSDEEQARAKHIFTQLVQPGDATEDTRRLANREEVREDNWDLVTRLANARLVVSDRDEATGEDTVEIVHEAMIGGWDRLKGWIEADRDFRTWQERLRAARHQWEQSGRDEGALLRGAPLSEAEHWLEERPYELSQAEQDYIQASVSQREWERDTEETRKEHELQLARDAATAQKRAASRLRYLAVALALFSLVAVFLSVWAVNESQRADQNRQLALANASEAQANAKQAETNAQLAFNSEATAVANLSQTQAIRLGDEARLQAHLQGSPSLIALLSLRSMKITRTDEGEAALATASILEFPSRELRAHTSGVPAVVFSQDGKRAITGSFDRTARLWDIASGVQIGEPFTQTGSVRGAAFLPGSNAIITASSGDKAVRRWDLNDNIQPRWVFTDHEAAVIAMAMSSDGKLVATGSEDNTSWVIDTETGKGKHHLINGHKAEVSSVDFSPDPGSKYIVTASKDGTARLWDTASGEATGVVFTATSPIVTVAFSKPDGRYVLTGGFRGSLNLWNIETGQREVFDGQTGIVLGVAFSPDGKYVVSGSDDGTIRLWETATRKEVRRLTGIAAGVSSIAFSPDGHNVLIGSYDEVARLWDLQAPIRQFLGHTDALQSAVFSPNGDRVLTTSLDHTARIWEAATGRQLLSFTGHTDVLGLGTFSSDGKMALTGSFQNDGTARLWDINTGQEKFKVSGHVKDGHAEVIYGVTLSQDGKNILTAGWDYKARLWEAFSNKPPVVFDDTEQKEVYSAVFSPDKEQKWVLTATADGIARLWDRKGKVLHKFEQEGIGGLYSAVFSPDGQYILTASSDNIVYLWKATEPWGAEPIRKFEGHQGPVLSARFSRDGKTVLTASQDKTARLWDTESGKPLRKFEGHTAAVESAEFSPDGKSILTASDDKTARLWDVNDADTITYLCGRLKGADFSSLPLEQYHIDSTSPCPK
jgi:WD40 repeat protein